jgi:uncharacterized protein (DUF58 family)
VNPVPLLDPELLMRLIQLRFVARRRVEGRFVGRHGSGRYGSSLDFVDYRPYVAGDDPRWVDPHTSARLGRLLVRLFEAEEETALRIVLDCSASMGFGDKFHRARQVAAVLAAIAVSGGDRVRLLLAGATCDAGPWFLGASSLPRIEARLLCARTDRTTDLRTVLARAHGDGPRGPVILVTDLLDEKWSDILRTLAGRWADRALVHILGRSDLDPDFDDDLRLADSETGVEVEVGLVAGVLEDYRTTTTRWLDEVSRECGGRRIAYARLVDDEPVEDLLLVTLTGLGMLT